MVCLDICTGGVGMPSKEANTTLFRVANHSPLQPSNQTWSTGHWSQQCHCTKMAFGQIYWIFLHNKYNLGSSHVLMFIPQKEAKGCVWQIKDFRESRHLLRVHLQPATVRGSSVGVSREGSAVLSKPINGDWISKLSWSPWIKISVISLGIIQSLGGGMCSHLCLRGRAIVLMYIGSATTLLQNIYSHKF